MDAAVSIDIGGTQTKVALVGRGGEILHRQAFDSQAPGGLSGYMGDLFDSIEGLLRQARSLTVGGIGIGAPACDERQGTLSGTSNLFFKEPYPLRDTVRERFQLPVQLVKDSSAAALGEYLYGGARGMNDFVLITLGTGLGSAIMVEGRLVRGASGLASEFGHSLAVPNGRHCGCGRRGCLETYVSGRGIVRTAFALMAERIDPSSLRERSFLDTTAEHLFRAASAGDPLAIEAFQRTGRALGQKISDLIVALEPRAVFLSGGLAEAGDLLLVPAREALERNLLPFMRGKVDILPSELGAHDAALLGAAATILHKHKMIAS